jgi:manganese/zinc/iron transport system substrate-binding protein
MKRILFFLLVMSIAVFSGCSPADSSAKKLTYPYKIATTCGMVTNVVEEVAGDKAKVTGIMGESVDPHLHRPTRDDVKLLHGADVIFYSGLMLEGRMADVFSKAGRGGKPVYAVTENLDEEFLLEPPEFEGHWDPHVWTDVSAWSEAVGVVAMGLSEFDADNAEVYAANAATYRAKLAKLHEYGKAAISGIPEGNRILITAHDAFGYFGRAYGIEVRAVQGLTTESEAGIKDINDLVDLIVERKISAVFVESSVSDKAINAVIEGANSKGWKVNKGGTLFSDAMGARGTYEGTYIGMMDHNFTTIAKALGGKVPDGGFKAQPE